VVDVPVAKTTDYGDGVTVDEPAASTTLVAIDADGHTRWAVPGLARYAELAYGDGETWLVGPEGAFRFDDGGVAREPIALGPPGQHVDAFVVTDPVGGVAHSAYGFVTADGEAVVADGAFLCEIGADELRDVVGVPLGGVSLAVDGETWFASGGHGGLVALDTTSADAFAEPVGWPPGGWVARFDP
jgi:hypothetical protein